MRRVGFFLARRILAGAFVVLAVITLTFVIYWAIPANPPASFVYPFAPHLTAYQITYGNHLLGVDKPKLEQYVQYVLHIARGDFGHSWAGSHVNSDQSVTRPPINGPLFAATRVTASLLIGGALVVLMLALPLGAIAARYAGSIGDKLIGFLTLVAICTHPMVIGLIMRTVFGNKLHWLPDSGYCTFVSHPAPAGLNNVGEPLCGGGPWQWFDHLILPWISFALLFLALYTRMSRASMLEVLHDDFVRTARAKGASEARVMGRHVVPNAGIRVLTMVGMEIGTAIGIAVYIEAAFGLNGLASFAVFTFSGGNGLDLPVILAVVTMITLVVVVGNLVVDLLYAVVDPRVGGTAMRAHRDTVTDPVVV